MRDLAAALADEFGPGWRTGDAAGEAAVAAFEAANGVSLPAQYRTFVAATANGAIGPPHYGLVPLGERAGAGSDHLVRPGSLAQPFPLTGSWVWEGAVDLGDPETIERLRQVHECGTLPLGTDGDGTDHVLVVTGDARGQVWLLTGEGAGPVARDFESWILGDYLPEAEWMLDSRPKPQAP